jgi:hypothetical protein
VVAAGSVRDWNRIASKLPGRMNKDCRKRYSKISDHIKKGNWQVHPASDPANNCADIRLRDPGEDTKLREAVKAVGTR